MHDAHVHIKDLAFLSVMKEQAISGIMNVSSIGEYRAYVSYQAIWQQLYFSAGIHPWEVEQNSWDDMEQFMAKAPLIGEVGLDNVWCKVDKTKQMDVFERSLAFGCECHKPVILHLKGMEKDALPMLKRYPNTYMIHWYSCENHLQEFIDLDCYFTIGPSIKKDKAVQQVAKNVPLHRLLIESDGLDALEWCEDRPLTCGDYPLFLRRTLDILSQIRDRADIEMIVDRNYHHFISSITEYD